MAHIDLESECDVRPHSAKARNSIFDFLEVENDVPNRLEAGIHFCHLCECHSANGWCLNPLHIYVGTAAENHMDISPEGRSQGAKATVAAGTNFGGFAAKSRGGRLGGINAAPINRANGTGFFDPEVRRQGREITNTTYYISTITGHISTAGPVSLHNKARGGDKTDKVRLTPEDAELLRRLGASRFVPSFPSQGGCDPTYNTGEVS